MSVPSPFVGLLDVRPQQPGQPCVQVDPVPDAHKKSKVSERSPGVSAAFQSLLDQILQQHQEETKRLEQQVQKLRDERLKHNTPTSLELLQEQCLASEEAYQAQSPQEKFSAGDAFAHSPRLRKQHVGKREMNASQLLDAGLLLRGSHLSHNQHHLFLGP